MRSNSSRRVRAALASGLAAAALAGAAPFALAAAKPHVTTGAAAHVTRSSAQLTALIIPHGTPTSYYFQWGTSSAFGKQTPTVNVGAPATPPKLKVGQEITGLVPSVVYHYRVVGLYGTGLTVLGRERTFSVKGSKAKLELTKITSVTVGSSFLVTGTLSGTGNAGHAVVLQASPYPFHEAFAAIGVPATTNATGHFAFRVANLSRNTEFRALTQDLRPVYSQTLTVHAAVHVTFHVRSSGQVGLVRLYGTVSPAVPGAQVEFQVQKAIRPNRKEETTRYVTQFSGKVKKGTKSYSLFSSVVTVRKGGRYRAFVKIPTGELYSGASTQTYVLHAAPKKTHSH